MSKLILDIVYGSLPAPTFKLPDGRLQPDFLMDTIPNAGFFAIGFAIAGLSSYGAGTVNPLLPMYCLLPIAVHWLLFFLHGLPYRSEKLFDLAGQLGFSLMLFVSLYQRTVPSMRSNVVSLLACVWSFRLGYFLFSRFLERGEDWRFVRARNYPGFHFFTWTCQGLWCFLQGLSILSLHHLNQNPQQAPEFGTFSDMLGFVIWVLGLTIETVSDLQKLRFVRRYPSRANRPFIEEGLWYYSRHPNFAGESMCWMGLFVMCWAGIAHDSQAVAYAAVAPIFSVVFLQQTTVPW